MRDNRNARRCAKTGFMLVPSAARQVYRLAKPYYGPLNPIQRGVANDEARACWNRYDVEGQQTVYAASTQTGAYGELLAPLKPKLPTRASLYFDDVGADDELESLIKQEWQSSGYRPPRVLNMAWLSTYRLYQLRLPARGWFIDIEAASSLTAIARYAPSALVEHGLTEITVAELRGNQRWLTTAIATRIWPITLDDDTLAHGIAYGSRHGSEWDCWAIWLRRTGSAHAANGLVTSANSGIQVRAPAVNPALQTILTAYDLTVSSPVR